MGFKSCVKRIYLLCIVEDTNGISPLYSPRPGWYCCAHRQPRGLMWILPPTKRANRGKGSSCYSVTSCLTIRHIPTQREH